tara:strand:+ start:13948 stop:14229 length:282 start_codon:yes stop_codon:yes gene_type:complete
MKKFDDLQFVKFFDGVSTRVSYGDYELSVIRHSGSYGNVNGLYEIAVFQDNHLVEMPGITQEGDTVKGFLTEEDVTGIMKKMISITASEGEQI